MADPTDEEIEWLARELCSNDPSGCKPDDMVMVAALPTIETPIGSMFVQPKSEYLILPLWKCYRNIAEKSLLAMRK